MIKPFYLVTDKEKSFLSLELGLRTILEGEFRSISFEECYRNCYNLCLEKEYRRLAQLYEQITAKQSFRSCETSSGIDNIVSGVNNVFLYFLRTMPELKILSEASLEIAKKSPEKINYEESYRAIYEMSSNKLYCLIMHSYITGIKIFWKLSDNEFPRAIEHWDDLFSYALRTICPDQIAPFYDQCNDSSYLDKTIEYFRTLLNARQKMFQYNLIEIHQFYKKMLIVQ